MLPIRSKEETRALVKEFTKEHKEFLENIINELDLKRGNINYCPANSDCSNCPFDIENSINGAFCGSKYNIFGICFSDYNNNEDILISYIKEIIRLCYDDSESKTKISKCYTIIEDNFIKRYTLTDKVKRRDMTYGEILFKNMSFIVNGGTVIVINEHKTGGVIYGKKAKKHFRKLSKQNKQYTLKSIKHLSSNKIEQISFRIEENIQAPNNEIYDI